MCRDLSRWEEPSPGLRAARYAPGRGAGSCTTGAAPGILPMRPKVPERAGHIEMRETNPIEANRKPRFCATSREMCHFGALAADETNPTRSRGGLNAFLLVSATRRWTQAAHAEGYAN